MVIAGKVAAPATSARRFSEHMVSSPDLLV
jgi:hypothetical protein